MSKFMKFILIFILIVSLVLIGYIAVDIFGMPEIAELKGGNDSKEEISENLKSVSEPSYILAGVGSYQYRYTECKAAVGEESRIKGAEDDTVYGSFAAGLRSVFDSGSVNVKDITDSVSGGYSEMLTKGSVMAVFEYDLPFADYLKNIGVESDDADKVGSADHIALLSDGTVLVHDGIEHRHYLLGTADSRRSEDVTGLIEAINKIGRYSLQSISKLSGVENDTPVPVGVSVNSAARMYGPEQSGSDAAAEIGKAFFPNGEEFVNKMTRNDGSVLWTYGKGKKVLKISASGKVEYRENLDKEKYRKESFYNVLGTAVTYIENHGGWPEAEGASLYIRSSEPLEKSECEGFRIEFGLKAAGMDVMYSDEDMLSMEIFGKQVTSYIRNLPNISLIGGASSDNTVPAADPQEIIRAYDDAIADRIVNIFGGDDNVSIEKYTTEDKFYAVASGVNDARVVLVKNERIQAAEGEGAESASNGGTVVEFVPAWYMNIDDIDFWFDAVSGEMLKSSHR